MQSISSLASGVSKAVWGDSTAQQQSSEEPPSGETGNGTATEPFDVGNAAEQDQTNKTTTSAAAEDRLQNARAPSFALKETATNSVADPAASATTEDPISASGKPLDEPASTSAVKDDTNPNSVADSSSQPTKPEPTNPFDAKDTAAATEASRLRAERATPSPERSISPGARPDGSHAETGKTEKTKFSTKLKEKLHIGSSKH